jgi:hypothetical protein
MQWNLGSNSSTCSAGGIPDTRQIRQATKICTRRERHCDRAGRSHCGALLVACARWSAVNVPATTSARVRCVASFKSTSISVHEALTTSFPQVLEKIPRPRFFGSDIPNHKLAKPTAHSS